MKYWMIGLIDRIFAVLGALVFAQLPLFMQQYQHQLFGHIAELRVQTQAMETIAAAGGKTLPQFIQKFTESADPDFMRQGELMFGMTDRLQTLSQGMEAISAASPLSKFITFFQHVNVDIAKATLTDFRPGIPLTLEGGAYALAGVAVGFLFFYAIKKTFLLPFSYFKFLRKEQG